MHRHLIAISFLLGGIAFAAPLSSSAKRAIPAEAQQVISIDQRAVQNSSSFAQIQERFMPDELKQFSTELEQLGVSMRSDVSRLIYATVATREGDLRMVGLAEGQFSAHKSALQPKLLKKGMSAVKTLSGGMQLLLLDDSTIVFSDPSGMKLAQKALAGEGKTIASNGAVLDLIASVQDQAVWSVLDAQGTQHMVKESLGDARKLAEYSAVKNRFLGTRYSVQVDSGVSIDMAIVTSDNFSANTLASLVKTGLLYKKLNAKADEKAALENVTVETDARDLKIRFKADAKKMNSLVQSDVFASFMK